MNASIVFISRYVSFRNDFTFEKIDFGDIEKMDLYKKRSESDVNLIYLYRDFAALVTL